MRARYEFDESWEVAADPARVHELLADVEHYPDWWPQVLAAAYLGPDDGLVLCRSTLPYTLELHLHALVREPRLLEVEVAGTMQGRVRWRLTPAGAGTRVHLEQRVDVFGALALASLLGRPVLRWNHARMMRGCRTGLASRLA